MTTSVAEFQQAIAAFTGSRTREPEGWTALLANFNEAFQQSREDRAVYTPRLNVLNVFGLKLRELRHSQALAWFLDEQAEHEQGPLFLEGLMKCLGQEFDDCKGSKVQREKPEHVDVAVLKKDAFAIFIENKVQHHERDEQIAALTKALIRFGEASGIPERNRFAVFLTDDGRPPDSAPAVMPSGFLRENLHPIKRSSLFTEFVDRLEIVPRKSPLLSNLLTCYLDAIRTHPGAET